MTNATKEVDRTLLIVGSLSTGGIGLLDSASKKENVLDGTWYFQDIIALDHETKCRTMFQDHGDRVTFHQNLPTPTSDDWQATLATAFVTIQPDLEDVTHVAFTGLTPDSRCYEYARAILQFSAIHCPRLKYCISIYSTTDNTAQSGCLFHDPEPGSLSTTALLHGLKWADLRYDIMLGFSANQYSSAFDPFYALCTYLTLNKFTAVTAGKPDVPFPLRSAYDTDHSFIDQHHIANLALYILEDLEDAERYHTVKVNAAAAGQSLKWRELWPTICTAMSCEPEDPRAGNASTATLETFRTLVRDSSDAWNRAFTNNWHREQPRVFPWPGLSEDAFEECFKKLTNHRQNTSLDLGPLQESGYYGQRTLEELCVAIRYAIARMKQHSLLLTDAGFSTERKSFKQAQKWLEEAAREAARANE